MPLDERARKCLLRAGDVLLPRFSSTNAIQAADGVIDALPDGDRTSLVGLLRWLAVFPRFVLKMLFWVCERDRFFPGSLGVGLRLLALGLKGTIYTLYYGDEGVLHEIGWDAEARAEA